MRKIALLYFCALLLPDLLGQGEVYFTTGFKVGEVRENSAMIWTRLCARPGAVPVWHERKDPPFRSPINFDDNMPVEQMDGAVPGTFGEVRVILQSDNQVIESDWEYVSAYQDYTWKTRVDGLLPNTNYRLSLEGRAGKRFPVAIASGSFRTAPSPGNVSSVIFTSTSCQYFWDYDDPENGFKIYESMGKLNPHFHCQTGDYVYYDKPGPMANSVELARHKWHANNSWPWSKTFYSNTPVYMQKDDHDMMFNDASPNMEPFGQLSFQDGLRVWQEQVPVSGKPYRTFRWGKDLQIWVVEGREFRSDNWISDGDNKSIWGIEQKDWFVRTVLESDATYKILVSPTPVVGPDRSEGKNDNHSNKAFDTEGHWLRRFLGEQGLFVINGDRHWQYVSKDPGSGVMEFSQGPSSDSHAQGWPPGDFRPEHQFLRVKGGFLAVEVKRLNDIPSIRFTHYDVNGNMVNEVTF